MNKGILIVVSGPSGAGKGTICHRLLNKRDDIVISISTTTREPREGEVHGVNYFFENKEKFQRMIDNGEFLESAQVYGNYYGTPREYVEKRLNGGKNVLLEIDIQGALNIKKIYPEGVFIFILPPTMEELRNRIVGRGTESQEDIKKRFDSAYKELEYAFKYDYAVVNDKVDLAVEKVEAIIMAEKCRVSRKEDLIKQL